jgi:hypothetical protein
MEIETNQQQQQQQPKESMTKSRENIPETKI